MNGTHPINVNVPTSTIPSSAVQNPYPQITNPSVYPAGESTGTYPLNSSYGPKLLRDLATLQRAHPEITHQKCPYIADPRLRGTMYALSTGQGVNWSSSQNLGGFLSVLPHDDQTRVSSKPLSRTESCPLPGPTLERSEAMRRQHSSVDPSTIPGGPFQHSPSAPTDPQYRTIQIHQGPPITHSTANNTMYLMSTLSSSFPPAGLPIQYISEPATGAPTSYIPALIPSAIAEYMRNFRDDPFSSVRGNACSQSSEQIPIENVTVRGVPCGIGFDGGPSQGAFPTQLSHPSLAFPYTIDLNSAAFTAPRMETQQSASTFFDSASTNPDLESMDDFLTAEMDMGLGMNGELQAELAGLVDMSTSQLTVRDDQRVPVAPAPMSSFHCTRGLELTQQTMHGSFVHTLSADLQVLPELTDTVGTPSSPPQMSRQHSSATGYTNNFSSVGTYPHLSAPIDIPTAPAMGRGWSDLSNPAMPTFYDGPSSFDGQRKRVRQPPQEDIELLLKGAGDEAGALAASACGQYYADGRAEALPGAWSNIPDMDAWQRLNAQLSFAADKAQALEQLARECGLDAENPAKLRRVDGQDVHDARAHAKSVEAATLRDVNSSSNFRSFVPTTHPLPAFDQHLAMSRSESGALSNTIQPLTSNNGAQLITTTTVTTSAVIDINTVPNTSSAVPRSGGSAGPISINTQMASRTYSRRTHPRVFCDLCEEVPDGFRGDHELRRHKERVHAEKKKVWVTKDISPDGDFLSGCKACKRGKHYFVDYNAAAHLRRQHFCKEGKRGKSRKEHDEKRRSNIEKVRSKLEKWGIEWREDGPDSGRGGGSRTGEEFTLKFLRRWMHQIEIPRADYESKDSLTGVLSDEDEDDENDESDELKDQDELQGPQEHGSSGRLISEPTLVANAQRNEKILHPSPTNAGIPSETLHPVAQPQEAQFQPPPPYELIDVTPSADLPPNFLQSQMHRELQALLEPALERVDLSLDSFYRLQNGLG